MSAEQKTLLPWDWSNGSTAQRNLPSVGLHGWYGAAEVGTWPGLSHRVLARQGQQACSPARCRRRRTRQPRRARGRTPSELAGQLELFYSRVDVAVEVRAGASIAAPGPL